MSHISTLSTVSFDYGNLSDVETDTSNLEHQIAVTDPVLSTLGTSASVENEIVDESSCSVQLSDVDGGTHKTSDPSSFQLHPKRSKCSGLVPVISDQSCSTDSHALHGEASTHCSNSSPSHTDTPGRRYEDDQMMQSKSSSKNVSTNRATVRVALRHNRTNKVIQRNTSSQNSSVNYEKRTGDISGQVESKQPKRSSLAHAELNNQSCCSDSSQSHIDTPGCCYEDDQMIQSKSSSKNVSTNRATVRVALRRNRTNKVIQRNTSSQNSSVNYVKRTGNISGQVESAKNQLIRSSLNKGAISSDRFNVKCSKDNRNATVETSDVSDVSDDSDSSTEASASAGQGLTSEKDSSSTVASLGKTKPKSFVAVDIGQILQRHALGQTLLKTRVLNAATRATLTDILANHMIINISPRITKEHYSSYAKAIVGLFPDESENLYFIPSIQQSTPKGKLYSRVNNILAMKRTLEGKTSSRKRLRTDDGIDCVENEFLDTMQDEDPGLVCEWSGWLRTNKSPETKVLDLWNKTAKARLMFIMTDKPTVNDILNQWPRYADDQGYVLINEDFSMMHPGKANRLTTSWPNVSAKLAKVLCRSKDKEAKKLQHIMCETTNAATRLTTCLTLLPSYLTEQAVATLFKSGKRRNFWKPSAAESMSYFVDLQKPGLDLQNHLRQKEAAMKQLGLNLQPHVVVICENLDQLETVAGSVAYAVIQSNLIYEMPSVVSAVDACFKAFYVMNLEYPAAAKSTWTFLQHAIYQVGVGSGVQPGAKVLELTLEMHRN